MSLLLLRQARARGSLSQAILPGKLLSRHYSFSINTSRRPLYRRQIFVFSSVAATIGFAGLGLLYREKSFEDVSKSNEDNPLANVPFSSLFRAYFVYTCCSIPFLVDRGPALIDWCSETSIPGVWPTVEYLIRKTFFPQFVGGETAEECLEISKELSKSSLGSILNYSAEVHEKVNLGKDVTDDCTSKLCADKVKSILHLIETAGRYNKGEQGNNRNRDSIMVAVKLSGLIRDASVLERASACLIPRESFSEPPTTTPPSSQTSIRGGAYTNLNIPTASLSNHDVDSIKQLWKALQVMAASAKRNGNIRILIDAEYSWYQPAIDALFEACAQEFNAIPPCSTSSWWSAIQYKARSNQTSDHFQGPLIYNTLQAYLRRTPSYLAMSLERAKKGQYALGIKLVRGAYVDQENREWSTKIVPTPPSNNGKLDQLSSPVWPNKALTDQCYDKCANLLIREVAADLNQDAKKSSNKDNFARLSVVLAGHNWISNMTAVQTMIDIDLALPSTQEQRQRDSSPCYQNLLLASGVRGRIHFAQLYGMADDLTRALQSSFDNSSGGPGPHLVLKYIPYGGLKVVMPYLVRRAQENKSIMGGGGAQKERAILAAEMRRRLLP